jgi:hypothetical protein
MMLVVRMRRDERRAVDWFRSRGALDAARAVHGNDGELGAIARLMHQRLTGAGVIRQVPAGLYFDEDAYAQFRANRQRRALIVLAVLVAAVAVAMLTGVVTL